MNYQPYMYGYQQPNIYQQPFGYQQPNAQPIKNPQTEQYNQPQQVQQVQQPQQMYKQALFLQGKSVDSVDVVKAMDIPLDGSISYFPLVDGSSIVTKQLMQDGTSKVIIYKPAETMPKANTTENKEIYVTEKQLEEKLSTFNNEELKQEIEKLKKQIKELMTNTKK